LARGQVSWTITYVTPFDRSDRLGNYVLCWSFIRPENPLTI